MIGDDEKAAARASIEAQIARMAEAERQAKRPPPRLVVEEANNIRVIKQGELISFCVGGYDDHGVICHAVAARDIPPDELIEKMSQVGPNEGKCRFCDQLCALLISEGAATPIVNVNVTANYNYDRHDYDGSDGVYVEVDRE